MDVTWLPGSEKNTQSPDGFTLNKAVALTLKEAGVSELYSHQKKATLEVLKMKKSVVIATPTASGKSLCYLLSLLTRLSKRKSSRAVLLFPLKALARDQLLKPQKFTSAAGRLANSGKFDSDKKLVARLHAISKITSACCDGDSTEGEKKLMKDEKTQVILTNPDTLHHRIFPGYTSGKWSTPFWQNLEFIVLDEAQTQRGVAGSHVSNVLRRVLQV